MTPTAAGGQEAQPPWPMKDAAARVCRWFFYSVVLAVIPIVISFAWLPKNTSVTALLSHGDLAVIASALLGLSMGEIFGSEEPQQNWIREVLIGACILCWSASLLLLSFISGGASRFTQNQEVQYSWWLLLAAVIVGIASFAVTVSRT